MTGWTTWFHSILVTGVPASSGTASGSLIGLWLQNCALALPAVTVAVRVAAVLGRWVDGSAGSRRSAMVLAALATSAISTGVAALLQATSLPFIVAATMIGIELGRLDAATGAALIAAGLLSVLVFPLAALTVARGGTSS